MHRRSKRYAVLDDVGAASATVRFLYSFEDVEAARSVDQIN